MRLRWLAALPVAVLLGTPACGPGDDAAWGPLDPPAAPLGALPRAAPAAPLCDAIDPGAVAAATGHADVTADGAGTQCSWRAAAGPDVVLQGSFVDARTFEVARADGDGSHHVPDVGDQAYVVPGAPGAPTTLYVRDGNRTLALWLTDAAGEPADALAGLARQALIG